MANHKRWIKENTDPDSYDKIDWEAETDRSLTPSESRAKLRAKHPEAFKQKEQAPSKTEIRQMQKEEQEIDSLYEEYVKSFEKAEQPKKPELVTPTPERRRIVTKIKIRVRRMPPERREQVLREKPLLRREPMLRKIWITTKTGTRYYRVRKQW